MDVKQYMIVDLEKREGKRKFITERVSFINNGAKGLWDVRFAGSERMFHYNRNRLLCMKNPTKVDLTDKGVYINNRHITNVAEMLCFTDGRYSFYHVTYNSGYYEDFDKRDVYITRTPIDKNGGGVWEYLKKIAAETGLMTEDEANLLSKQYELVDVHRDTVPLAQYLGDKTKLKVYEQPKVIYYPFNCNASQKRAVEAALTHQVSIVQGPPGTGKTQTILNIIANLLMMDKSVLVVSNNNSAVENVAEKLDKEGLGFIVAQLGSVQHKEQFMMNQPEYPDRLMDWIVDDDDHHIARRVIGALARVTQGFESQTRRAELNAAYDALLKEMKYYDMLGVEVVVDDWLRRVKTSQLLRLMDWYKREFEKRGRLSLWFRLRWTLRYGRRMYRLLRETSSECLSKIERAYYDSSKAEMESELRTIDATLKRIDVERGLEELKDSSLILLKDKIARRYMGRMRGRFTMMDYKLRTEEFLKEYPVVLSTTYSAKGCINKNMVFDYVIMDEASQVDIKTGALALACAKNAVIVGDDKQLPNVVTGEERLALDAIQSTYHVDEKYNEATHSFLQSCVEVFNEAPSTLLREHYRCHPKIIEFCNQRFYDGELVTMTKDKGEEYVLQVVRTVKGNHAREHFNQREIEVIKQEVMPEYFNKEESLGIITPYRLQADEINREMQLDIASTVHKYQGRECDTIIMSMVDNSPTEFSDDANLLNVAISRAKKHLCIVTNGNEMDSDSNLAQLIAYIQYNNFEVRESKIHSVFDLLYKQYTAERLAYEAKHEAVSEHLSENLVYGMIVKAIEELELKNVAVLCHYPLSKLIGDWSLLEDEERRFAESSLTHVDFLLYNSLTKQPRMVIEVDGWKFHKESEVQQSRDVLKDKILGKCGLKIKRISTTDTVNVETMKEMLQ